MSISGNLNYLKRIFRHPCKTPDIEIVIETAFQAALPALMQVIGIGCTDIIKMRVGKAPFHSRKMKALINKAIIPEVVGKNIYRYSVPYLALEAGLWWWMVVDAGASFLPHWASLMYQESKCTLPRNGFIETPLLDYPFTVGGPYHIPPLSLESKACVRFDGTGVAVSRGCAATVTYYAPLFSFLPSAFGPGIAEVWLQDDDGNTSPVERFDANVTPSGIVRGGGLNLVRGSAISENHIRVMIRVISGVVYTSGGHIDASGYGLPIPIVTGGCTPRAAVYPWS